MFAWVVLNGMTVKYGINEEHYNNKLKTAFYLCATATKYYL